MPPPFMILRWWGIPPSPADLARPASPPPPPRYSSGRTIHPDYLWVQIWSFFRIYGFFFQIWKLNFLKEFDKKFFHFSRCFLCCVTLSEITRWRKVGGDFWVFAKCIMISLNVSWNIVSFLVNTCKHLAFDIGISVVTHAFGYDTLGGYVKHEHMI